MCKWHIYLELNEDKDPKSPNFGKTYYTRRYYRKELSDRDLKRSPSIVKYLAAADLPDDYFIPGSVTRFFPVDDLGDIELLYRASTKKGRIIEFSHTFQELLERAVSGILPYMSFAEHKVIGKPIVKIKGIDQ